MGGFDLTGLVLCASQMDLGSRPEVQRREPLSAEDWVKHQDAEGRVLRVPQLKQVIFKGACCIFFINQHKRAF